jgi:hypothetical protein
MNTIASPPVDNTPLGIATEFLRKIGRSDPENDPGGPDFIDSAARAIPEIDAALREHFPEDRNLLGGRMFGAGVTFGALTAIAVMNASTPIEAMRSIAEAIKECVDEIESEKLLWLGDCQIDIRLAEKASGVSRL